MSCKSDTHSKHICYLTEKGQIQEAHKLSLQPTVECGVCGAKAKDMDSVCDPVQLPDVGWMGDGAD